MKEKYKEKLIDFLYGGLYPFFWTNYTITDKLNKISEEMGINSEIFFKPELIRFLLTEEDAKRVLKYLKASRG